MDDSLRLFLLGSAGSVAVEVANIVRTYEDGKPLSVRYRRPMFVIVRLMMAAVGGMLAWAYHVQNDLLALNVGASAPLLMQSLTRVSPETK